jgi:hypothetical protein
MPGEPTTTDLDWTRLQSTVLEGGYQLEGILAAEEGQASFKVRVLGDSSANAFAKLFVAGASEADEQAAVWESARQLKSKHLAVPLGAGRGQLDGTTFAYVVLRRPDETLDAAVRERALSKEEAGDVLLALVRALEELHSHELVHGCVSPEQVIAIGDSIQLSTECVRRAGVAPRLELPRARSMAPESVGANVTASADVWCLGATLVEILTQRRCGENCLEEAAKLPPPFDAIGRRCLDADPAARMKVGQVEALFRGRAPAPVATKPPLAAAAAAGAGAAAAVSAGSVPAQRRTPVGRPAAAVPSPARNVSESKFATWWLYAAAGIVVVFGLIWLFRPRHTPVPAGAQNAAKTAPAPGQGTAWESKTITPEDAKTVSRAQPAAATPTAPTGKQSNLVKGPVWRVVLYTYAREADAQNKARWVNEKYPGLGAEVFSPSGGSPYVVSAGGQMSREEALKLRQKVRSLGLPRDSYIQNYQK